MHGQETFPVPEYHAILVKGERPTLQYQPVGILTLYWQCAKCDVTQWGRVKYGSCSGIGDNQ
jgi:hypothetical protein